MLGRLTSQLVVWAGGERHCLLVGCEQLGWGRRCSLEDWGVAVRLCQRLATPPGLSACQPRAAQASQAQLARGASSRHEHSLGGRSQH